MYSVAAIKEIVVDFSSDALLLTSFSIISTAQYWSSDSQIDWKLNSPAFSSIPSEGPDSLSIFNYMYGLYY